MNKLKAYQASMATKLHITGSYDVSKHGLGKNRFNQQSLNKRNDAWVFQKLAEQWFYQERLMYFIASVYVSMPKVWIGELVDKDEYKPFYHRLKRFISAPVDNVVSDTLTSVRKHGTLASALDCREGIPGIVNDTISGDICPETLVMYNRMMGLFERLNNSVGTENPIWKSVGHRLTKYQTFVTIADAGVVTECKRQVSKALKDT